MQKNEVRVCSCLHCLKEGTLVVRIDKRGRPWTNCSACGTRSFIHTDAGLTGLRFLAPQLLSLIERMGGLESVMRSTAVSDDSGLREVGT